MIPAALLPPARKPPHDPRALILTAQTLWGGVQSKKNLRIDAGSKRIQLQHAGAFRRSLADINGTFGGLVLPSNVALGWDGSIYLLDRSAATLKRFDPCECRFVPVPRLGGIGGKARELRNPGGIGICRENLFVCDTGFKKDDLKASECENPKITARVLKENHRLTILSLRGFTLRGHWTPPRRAYEGPKPKLTKFWEPVDVDFDSQGRVYVSDASNGCIHRFSPHGVWLEPFLGLGRVSHLAIDCQDRIYVVIDDSQTIKVLDPTGQVIEEIAAQHSTEDTKSKVKDPAEFSSRFPGLPFAVDHQGRLHLAEMCLPSSCPDRRAKAKQQGTKFGVFDLNGEPVEVKLQATTPQFETKGKLISTPLDSELYRCVWHRAVLQGEIPTGTYIDVATITSEIEHSPEEIKNLFKDRSLNIRLTPNGKHKGDWDVLVRSQPGRYLWLKLTFGGNGSVSPMLGGIQIEFPRISLRRYLPAVFGEEPVSADFTDRFLSLFDTTFRSIENTIDNLAGYFDPGSTPAERHPGKVDFLSWLASWIGVTFDRQWPEERRRRFLKQAGKLFPLRGTRRGLWQELLLYLGMEPERICCRNNQPQARCAPVPQNCAPLVKESCYWQPPPLILEHFQLRHWLYLGLGRLHDQAVLWGKQIVNRTQLGDKQAPVGQTQLITRQDPLHDPFHVDAHQFSIFVPARVGKDERERKGLENLLKSESPVHTKWTIHYVEPRFRIGFQSMIGLDAVVGRYPQGVTLQDSRLGQGTVLSPAPGLSGAYGFSVGKEARVGSSTQLS